MEFKELPIIDWELSIKLMGTRGSAEEMLNLLVKRLPNDLLTIDHLHDARNLEELQINVHKLHGVLCYYGLPRVKAIVSRLETDLKNNVMYDLPSLLNQLKAEIKRLLEHYSPTPTAQVEEKVIKEI